MLNRNKFNTGKICIGNDGRSCKLCLAGVLPVGEVEAGSAEARPGGGRRVVLCVVEVRAGGRCRGSDVLVRVKVNSDLRGNISLLDIYLP